MSKGSKVCTFRIPSALAAKVEGEIISHNFHTKGSPWNMTDFLIKAIEEKIAHATRSRTKKRKGKRDSLVNRDKLIEEILTYEERNGVIHPTLEACLEAESEADNA